MTHLQRCTTGLAGACRSHREGRRQVQLHCCCQHHSKGEALRTEHSMGELSCLGRVTVWSPVSSLKGKVGQHHMYVYTVYIRCTKCKVGQHHMYVYTVYIRCTFLAGGPSGKQSLNDEPIHIHRSVGLARTV